jgi:hypothetical protein
MSDYKLDFGKLAYTKTEDLGKRITALENKKQDNYNSIYFKSENFNFSAAYEKYDYFNAQKNTDLNFNYKISGIGQFELAIYLNDVFVFAETVSFDGEKTFEFEARGIEKGEKNLKTEITGNAELSAMTVTVSGQNIEYNETFSNLSCVYSGTKDYILKLSEENLTLSSYDGINLTIIKDNFQKAKSCKILSFGEDKLLLFYTVWDGTLFYEIFDIALNKTIFKQGIYFNITKFTVCSLFDEIFIYYISDKKSYYSSAIYVNDRFIFSDAAVLNISNISELEAGCNNEKIYLIFADSNENSKFIYTSKNLNTEKEQFSFTISHLMEDIL